ncbi:hypothetical protein BCR43DRAFT_476403 [Syncephalastrum racemosum]|uniref:PIN domain-containing protein n=1 Tax=Syncephalastrum racemosum TaxID=13706 RepID=A0A1X2H7S0_SYNRA|nr:hypothetical protein BCR43DRAFT_476403 [Syncephalastrum racemosum]
MKALATQRLMEQVSSLEKNVNRMNLSSSPPAEEKPEVYTVVIDVTAFLDGLGKIKKWANQTLAAHRRSQRTILQVIVPLETIDALDMHKKGSSHMNMQARESIRYLDQKLRNDTKDIPTNTSFLRTQKIAEKIDWAKEGETFWMGEETIHTHLIGDISSDEAAEEEEHDDDDSVTGSIAGSDVESISSEDLFRPRRRQFDEDDEDSETSDEEDEEEEEQRDSDEEIAHAKEEGNTQTYSKSHDTGTVTFSQVPREYVAMLSCALYYLQQSPEMMVFVTNDEHLSWWAEMFGYRGQRLTVKTVDEWDKMVRSSLTK